LRIKSLSGKIVLNTSLKELISILENALRLFIINCILNLIYIRSIIKVLIKLALLIKKVRGLVNVKGLSAIVDYTSF
jgi:hypothetical protein